MRAAWAAVSLLVWVRYHGPLLRCRRGTASCGAKEVSPASRVQRWPPGRRHPGVLISTLARRLHHEPQASSSLPLRENNEK